MTKSDVRRPRRSAGVVVVRRHPDGWRCLVLRAFRYWDFPKGRVEAGEDPLAAAMREVAEETTLAGLALKWGEAFHETSPYAGGKVARYYVAESPRGEVTLPPSRELGRPEHHEYLWLPFDAARRLLVPRVQAVADWARAIVEGSG